MLESLLPLEQAYAAVLGHGGAEASSPAVHPLVRRTQ